MSSRKVLPLAFAAAMALLPTAALAHPGFGPATGFAHGFAHPISGLDHVLAMVMVGLLAYELGGRALWALPATFVLVMAAGTIPTLSFVAEHVVTRSARNAADTASAAPASAPAVAEPS